MNAAILLAPWRAAPRWTRWFVPVIATGATLATVLIGISMQRADWPTVAAGILALGEIFLGLFLLAPGLLLAVDGQHLRVPRLQRTVLLGMGLLALGLVVLPTAALGLAGGAVLPIACLLALGLCGGLLMGWLPRLLSASMWLLPAASQALLSPGDLPGPGDAGFVPQAAGALVVMLALCACCWWRQLRAGDPYRQGWWQPLVLQFRRTHHAGGWTGLSGGLPDSTQQIRQQPDWLRPRVDLGPTGPGRPRYSLRVAMGGMFVPMTLAGRARQLAMAVLPGTLVIALLVGRDTRRQGVSVWPLLADWATMFAWIGAFIGLLVGLANMLQLGQRWQKNNAELPLLALLPGLGSPARLRGSLLGASLLPNLVLQLVLLVLLFGLVALLHLGKVAVLAVLLPQLASVGVLVSFTLMIVGGRPLPGWGIGACLLVLLLLMGVTMPLALTGDGSATGKPMLLAGLITAWCALLLVLGWLGRRGWDGLRRRPHPFLPNED